MAKQTDLIVKNTELFGRVLKTNPPAVEKLEMILQILENLEFLKTKMDKAEFEKSFSELQIKVQNYLDKITDPKFVQDLIEKINKLLKKK